jgi:hypothetical protein
VLFSCKKENSIDVNTSFLVTKLYRENTSNKKIKFLDSLTNSSNQFQNDSIHRNFLFDISDEYYYNNQNKKSLNICYKVLTLSKIAKDSVSIAKAYSYIGDSYQISHKDSAYYYYQKAEKLNRILKKATSFFLKEIILKVKLR